VLLEANLSGEYVKISLKVLRKLTIYSLLQDV